MKEYIVKVQSVGDSTPFRFRVEAKSGPGAIKAGLGLARQTMTRRWLDSIHTVEVFTVALPTS